MSKPVVIAKNAEPEWDVTYDDNAANESSFFTVFGSPTIQDAISEAATRLNQDREGWYTITSVQLIKRRATYDVTLNDYNEISET